MREDAHAGQPKAVCLRVRAAVGARLPRDRRPTSRSGFVRALEERAPLTSRASRLMSSAGAAARRGSARLPRRAGAARRRNPHCRSASHTHRVERSVEVVWRHSVTAPLMREDRTALPPSTDGRTSSSPWCPRFFADVGRALAALGAELRRRCRRGLGRRRVRGDVLGRRPLVARAAEAEAVAAAGGGAVRPLFAAPGGGGAGRRGDADQTLRLALARDRTPGRSARWRLDHARPLQALTTRKALRSTL